MKKQEGKMQEEQEDFIKKIIKKPKAALYVFFKSLTTPQYYADLLRTKFSFSLKYILILALISSAVTATKTVTPLTNDLTNQLNKFSSQIINLFPQDLVITIDKGELSLNREEPFIVPVPENYMAEIPTNEAGEEIDLRNIVVVDPKGTIDDLDKYQTLILINKTNIITRQSNKLEVYPLKNLPDNEISRDDIIYMFEKAEPLYSYLPYLILLFAFLLALVYYFGFRMIYLTLVATILFIVSSIRGIGVPYDKLYQIGIHSMTLPLVIEVMTTVADFPINIPLWFLMLNLLMGLMGLFYIDKVRE